MQTHVISLKQGNYWQPASLISHYFYALRKCFPMVFFKQVPRIYLLTVKHFIHLFFDFIFRFICLTATQCFIHSWMFYLRLPFTYLLTRTSKGHLAEVIWIWFFNITKNFIFRNIEMLINAYHFMFSWIFFSFFVRSKGELMDHLRLSWFWWNCVHYWVWNKISPS